MHISDLPWDCAAILAALAVLLPWRGTVRMRAVLARPHFGPAERMAMYASTMVFQWMAVVITAWRAYARGWTLASLGLALHHPLQAIGLGVGVSVVLASTQMIGLRQLSLTPSAQKGVHYELMRKVMPQSPVEIPPFAALVVTVSICEEFLYRGFVYAALALVFEGSVLAAVLGSSVLFAFGHLYQGRRGLISTFVLGLLFAGMRVWTGSLLPGILAHLVADLVAGVAGPRLLARARPAAKATPTAGAFIYC